MWSEPVTFEGTISVTAPGGGTPTGTVRFQTDSVDIAGCTEAPIVSSTASCTTSALAFGAQQITAIYSGSPDHLTSTSANLQHTVDLAGTTTVVSSSDPTTTFDAPVTYTAAISPVAPATVAPGSGTVSFEVDSVPVAGCATQPVTAGAATCVTTSEPVGAPSITAVYSGDATRYSGSTSTAIIQTVGNASSAVAISSSDSSSVFSEEVTLTATTSAVAPATTTPAGGTMSFTVNTVPITGCTTQTVTAGVATCATGALPVGALNAISAVYSGDANFNTSTAPSQTQAVSKAATTSAAVSNQPTSTWNDSVTFTITVTQVAPATLAPSSGTASFTIAGTAIVGCEARPVVAGIATCVTSVVPTGTSSVIATYSTDPSYLSSVAPAVTQTVSRANTNIALVSNHHPSRFGQVITLTATVTSTAGTPTGTVSFFVRKKDMTFDLLGTRALAGGVASIDTAALPVRIGTVLATYNTSTNFLTSSREIDQTVSRSFSRTLMRSSDRTTSFGRPVSFSVVVASDGDGAGTPTGLVALYMVRPNNSRQWIGRGNLSSGATTIVVSDLPVGTYKIVAEYRGSITHRPSHRSLTQTITVPL